MKYSIQKRAVSALLSLILLLTLLPASTFAAEIVDSGACGAEGDNLTWTLDSEGTLTISGTGDMADNPAPWNSKRDRVKTAVLEPGVTSIGTFAFQGCTALTSVLIPDSVTSIGAKAFCNCVTLEDVTIPDSVTSIGNDAFWSCRRLTSIIIPASVTSIGNNPFAYCAGLKAIAVDDGSSAFYENDGVLFSTDGTLLSYLAGKTETSYAIPADVERIGVNAFRGATALSSIMLPTHLKSIEAHAFSSTRLTAFSMDGEDGAFRVIDGVLFGDEGTLLHTYPCGRNSSSYSIPDGVTKINGGAFLGVAALTSVTIPASVTNIGSEPFAGCTHLTEISVDGGNSAYQDIDGVLFSADGTQLCAYPVGKTASSYVVPDGVTTIYGNTFYESHNLTSIMLPNSLRSIKAWAFNSCRVLDNVVIPDGETTIESFAFYDCNALTNITIAASVEKIGAFAFQNDNSLTDVYFLGTEEDWTRAARSNSAVGLPDEATVHYNSTDPAIVASGACGAEGDNLTWTLDENGLLTIRGSGAMTNWDQASNAPWDSYRSDVKRVVMESGVTSVGNNAFVVCTALTSVTIPDGVTSIGYDAFHDCTALTGVTIPDSVTSIGPLAFFNCDTLTSVTIPNSVTSVGDSVFGCCDHLTAIQVGSGNTAYQDIDGILFSADSTLLHTYPAGKTASSYTVPDSVTCILNDAFMGCHALINVTIPKSVTSIEYTPFPLCDQLTNITVERENSVYKDIDGVLFSADGTLLRDYPGGKTASFYMIPDSVKNIGDYAFEFCDNLTSVTIPDGATSIGNYAFECCSNLTNVTIPASVTSVGSLAFLDCNKLTDIYFDGSEEQWQTAVGERDLDLSDMVTVHYGITPLTLTAVKFVPFYAKLPLEEAVGAIPEDTTCSFHWATEHPEWLELDPETGELSGVPREMENYSFKIDMQAGKKYYTGAVSLKVVDNSDAAVEVATAESALDIQRAVPDMSITNLVDRVFKIEDTKQSQETKSNFERFLDVYLDGVKLEGYKRGTNGVETIKDAWAAGWDYFAEAGSTKITIRAQTFKRQSVGEHTLAATFAKTDPKTGKLTRETVTAAQNFQIIEPIPPSKSRSGSGSSGSSTSPKPAVYYTGSFSYTIDAAQAKLETLTGDVLKQLKSGSGTLTIDLTGSGSTVTAVELPAGCMDQLAKLLSENGYDKLEFQLTGGAIELDADVAAAVAAQAAGKSVVVSFTEKTAAQLNDAQRKALEGKEVVKLFSVSITAGGREITDFAGGRVVVRMPLEPSKDARGYAVWHLAEDGKLSRHSTNCAAKELTFRSAHFSDFAVIYDERKKLSDVPDGMWYTSDVDQIVALGIMNGTPEGRFAPDDVLTRAMFAQILFNAEQGERGAGRVFEDVSDNEWYTDAVNWAAQAGVIDGVGNGRYESERGVTREELVNVLYKYASYKQYDISHTATLERFVDADRLSHWAKNAMEWAVGNKLINGMNGTLAAGSGATRAQAAKVLIYFLEQYKR